MMPEQSRPNQNPQESPDLILQEFLDELENLIAESRTRHDHIDLKISIGKDRESYVVEPEGDWEFKRPPRVSDKEISDSHAEYECEDEEKIQVPVGRPLGNSPASDSHSPRSSRQLLTISSYDADQNTESENRDNTLVGMNEKSDTKTFQLASSQDILFDLVTTIHDLEKISCGEAESEEFGEEESSDSEDSDEEGNMDGERERERESKEIMLAAVATAALAGVLWAS